LTNKTGLYPYKRGLDREGNFEEIQPPPKQAGQIYAILHKI